MATVGKLKAGLTVRNLREPEFTSPEGANAEARTAGRAGRVVRAHWSA